MQKRYNKCWKQASFILAAFKIHPQKKYGIAIQNPKYGIAIQNHYCMTWPVWLNEINATRLSGFENM